MFVLPCRSTHAVVADSDQCLVTISSLTVTNSRRRTVLNVIPNAFPATRISATRDLGDSSVIEYVQVGPRALLFSICQASVGICSQGSLRTLILYLVLRRILSSSLIMTKTLHSTSNSSFGRLLKLRKALTEHKKLWALWQIQS